MRIAVFVLLAVSAPALAQVDVPELRAPVTELTGTLTPDQIATLDRRLREFEASKGSQIAVLLVSTTQPETIEQYAIRVAENWRPGRKEVDDGVLLLVAKDDRAVRIEVGYGLEGALPDVIANRITDQVLAPRFRDGDFYGGLTEGVDRIITAIEGEPLPEASRGQPPQGIGAVLPVFLMLVLLVSSFLRRIFGTVGGALFTGGVAGVLVWILTRVSGIALGAAVIALLFTLFGGGGGRGWTSSRRGQPWGGGWGGSGGGWSGGGGSFGGGGASGRW